MSKVKMKGVKEKFTSCCHHWHLIYVAHLNGIASLLLCASSDSYVAQRLIPRITIQCVLASLLYVPWQRMRTVVKRRNCVEDQDFGCKMFMVHMLISIQREIDLFVVLEVFGRPECVKYLPRQIRIRNNLYAQENINLYKKSTHEL